MTNNPATLQLDKETITHTIPGHPSFTRIIDRSTDTLGRSTGFQLQTPTLLTDHSTLYTYSPTNGRFASVSGGAFQAPSQTFTYGYTPNSNLIASVVGPAHTVTNTYENNRDVLLTKHNQRASDNATISSVTYNVNKIGQRESVAQTFLSASSTPTTANIQWGYNATGEVTKADHSDTAQNRAYNYDGIGNRLNSSAGVSPASSTTYIPNALNQYTAVNTFTPTYDDDGNQINAQIHPQSPTSNPASLSPVSCVFSWDAQNRLTEVKDLNNNSLVKHHYDSYSRKIATITSPLPSGEGQGQGAQITTLYIYNGWNSIAEYQLQNSSFILHTSLLWGLDLSDSMQGAGGVGGLLSVTDLGSLITSYFPLYDGNGNITEYLDSNTTVVAHYEYDAFGKTTVATGSKANDFAYRFSTKPRDKLTGLYYYGYRWYDPLTGRWPSRDPIEENGGLNLYGFVGNYVINWIDKLGKMPHVGEDEPKCPEGWDEYDRPTVADFGYTDSAGKWGEVVRTDPPAGTPPGEEYARGVWYHEYRNAARFRFVEIGNGSLRQIGACHSEYSLNIGVSWGEAESITVGGELGVNLGIKDNGVGGTISGHKTFEWNEGTQVGSSLILEKKRCNRWMGIPMVLRFRYGKEHHAYQEKYDRDKGWYEASAPIRFVSMKTIYLNYAWLVCKKACDLETTSSE